MLNFEAIKKRHEAGSPACEDMGDLIAEVERLREMQKPLATQPIPLTPNDPPEPVKKVKKAK
jgi:hypothetical protein